MIRRYRDLPLARDATNRFLPWTVGLMVFVATLALAATMFLGSVGGTWRSDLAGGLTVQVLPNGADADKAALDRRTEKTIAFLRGTPGISSATPVTEERLIELLEPWLGGGIASADLPLPRLIDVRLSGSPPIDTAKLKERLSAEMPGATLDDHAVWLDRLIVFARGLEAVAICVMALIGAASIATVVFTTRTGLAVHREVIELLYLIGAREQYIAREFQNQAMHLGLRGAVAGFVLAAVTLYGLGHLSKSIEDSLLPALTLSVMQWLLLACLPIVAILIGTMTARITVLRSIGRRL